MHVHYCVFHETINQQPLNLIKVNSDDTSYTWTELILNVKDS